jgi:hypothetical protein
VNELNRRFVARLRLAGALVVVGLGIQVATLLEAHPFTFLSFLVIGAGLVVGGVLTLFWAWLAQ